MFLLLRWGPWTVSVPESSSSWKETQRSYFLFVWCHVCPRNLQVQAWVEGGLTHHTWSLGAGQLSTGNPKHSALDPPGVSIPLFLYHVLRARQERQASMLSASFPDTRSHIPGSKGEGSREEDPWPADFPCLAGLWKPSSLVTCRAACVSGKPANALTSSTHP